MNISNLPSDMDEAELKDCHGFMDVLDSRQLRNVLEHGTWKTFLPLVGHCNGLW